MMKASVLSVSAALILAVCGPAAAAEQTPAWQTPGYVMEEVTVTAPAPASVQAPAWQMPAYVMEEVVVTARMPAAATDPSALAGERRARFIEDPIAARLGMRVAFQVRHMIRDEFRDDDAGPRTLRF